MYVRQINVFLCQMRYGIHRCLLPASEEDRGDHAGWFWDPLRAGLWLCGHLGRGGHWWRQRMWDTTVRGNLVFLWCEFSYLAKKKKTQNNSSFIGIFLNYYMYLCIIDFGCGRERWWGIAIYIHVIVNVVLIHAPIFTTSGVVSQFVLDPYRCEDETHQVNSNFVIWQKHKWIYHVTRLIQWRCVNFV